MGGVLYIGRKQMEARAHIIVSGRVQGVFFRDHTRRWASMLGLSGWVRNLVDGRVEVLVEGESGKIENLIGKLREGPPMSLVGNVATEWEEYKNEFTGFRIAW
jgi:acylphosphatase